MKTSENRKHHGGSNSSQWDCLKHCAAGQFADIVIWKCNEFKFSVKEVPSAFRDTSITLPLLVIDLKKTKLAADAGRLAEDERLAPAILAVIEGCSDQINVRIMPGRASESRSNESRVWTRYWRKRWMQKLTLSERRERKHF